MKLKIDLPFLLLFAVVSSTTLCHGAESSSHGNSNQAESSQTGIDLSLDVTEDVDEQDSARAESKPQESSQYAPYQSQSSAEPEFGMRNQPSKSSVSQSESSDFGSFEPSISAAYKNLDTSSSQIVQREFAPSVYRLSDPARKPLFEAYNNEPNAQESSDERPPVQYGQAQSVSEMDSPYYSKATGQESPNYSQAADSQDSGFTPMSMSVDEAFAKYFPPRKEQEEGAGQAAQPGSGYAQQQAPQQQQPAAQSQQAQGQPQYMTTYTETTEQPPQQAPPSPSKEVFSIDSLREIVEKEPLARPDPFDPPSPPLSSFLPLPPDAQGQPQQQQSQPQPQYQMQQQSSQYSAFGQQVPAYSQERGLAYSQPVQTNYIYAKVPENQEVASPSQQQVSQQQQLQQAVQHAAGTAPIPVQPQSLPISQPGDEGEQPEESEDEGLAYNTENLDEDGKKVSYIYSRPVQLPDITRTKLVDASTGGQEIQEHVHYRKPVSYENEEDSPDAQSGPDDQGPISIKQTGPGGYDDTEGKGAISLGGGPSEQYRGQMLQMNQPISISAYSDEPNYKQQPQQLQQSQPQWTSGPSNNRPDFVDPSGKDGGPQNIEYGGFVPIKNQNGPSFPMPPPSHQQNNEPFLERPAPQQAPYDLPPQGGNGNGNGNFAFQEPRGPPPQFQQGPNFGGPGPLQNDGPNQNFNQPPPPPQQEQRPSGGHKFGPANFLSKLPHMRFRPLYGRDAMKKLRELGISEDEFYGTVNKILKNGPRGGNGGGPLYKGPMPFIPKANLYRSPPKNGPRGPFGANNGNKMRPLGNNIGDEFEFNYIKDGLPPGASYNPRDVGLDDSVLAQIHLQDSGIGGYRFPTMIPTGSLNLPPKAFRAGRLGFKKGPKGPQGPPQLPQGPGGYQSNQVPQAMNSMAMPFVFAGPRPFGPGRRVPYSATGKGFRSQYGYRAAASEIKPQFALPKPKPFKILGQPVSLGSAGISPLLATASSLDDSHALGNIFGIRSIKGIKSLVSYLTGGVNQG